MANSGVRPGVMNVVDARSGPLTDIEIGDRLRKARQAAGLNQSQAAKALSVSRPTLVAIERGTRSVKAQELRSLAERYGTAVNRLLSPSAVHLDLITKFRSLGRNPSDASRTVGLLNKLASAMVELERLLGLRPPSILLAEQRISRGFVDRQAEEAALTARCSLGLGLAPIPDFVALLEYEVGFRIFVRDLPRGISGVFGYESEAGACILLNACHSSERHAMTAAHELGHFILNRAFGDVVASDEDSSSNEERFANLFSYALLMPAPTVRKRFQELRASFNGFTSRSLVSMARSFYVSTQAMCRRLENLDLLPSGTFDSLTERGFKDSLTEGTETSASGPREPLRYGLRLQQFAAAALQREILSEGQLSRMLDLDRIEIRKLADAYGGGGDLEVDIS